MRRALLLAALLVLPAQPATATTPRDALRAPQAAAKPVPAVIPRPSVCDDYSALERGAGNVLNQDWFNHLDPRGYARARSACVYRWGATEWACLEQLWDEESSWTPTAGRVRGSYGIPQSQPGTKMAAAGPDWQTNPRTQIRWGLAYIHDRYGRVTRASLRGRPCHAGY